MQRSFVLDTGIAGGVILLQIDIEKMHKFKQQTGDPT